MVALTDTQYHEIIQALLHGCPGCRPNKRVAAILTAEANLGMRVGDILRLRMADIVRDGGRWRLNMTEEKTGKKRTFSVPEAVYGFLRGYADSNGIADTELLFPVCVYSVQKQLKKVCDFLGYANISTHSFRNEKHQQKTQPDQNSPIHVVTSLQCDDWVNLIISEKENGIINKM